MIETERLLIKPLLAEELIKHIKFPDELAKELGFKPSKALIDEETQEAIINDLLPNIVDPNKDSLFYTMWIIIEKKEKAIIGGICFHGQANERGEVEIGYGIDDEYMNKGYMTEIIQALLTWLEKRKDVRIVKAETEKTNISSIRVLEKTGFKLFNQVGDLLMFKYNL